MACGCGGNSKLCSCTLAAGTNITITGVGSSSNPYVISSSGGGGGGPVTTTIAGLNTLATGGSLVVGTKYIVTDWVSGTGSLPGPNLLLVDALDAHTPSGFVQVKTPLGPAGPCDGEFLWNYGGSTNLMTRLRDTLGNDVQTVGGTAIDAFPWGDGWEHNTVQDAAFVGGYTQAHAAALAGVTVTYNTLVGTSIDFGAAPNASSGIQNCQLGPVTISAGAFSAQINLADCYMLGVDVGATIAAGASSGSGTVALFGVAIGDATITAPGAGAVVVRRSVLGGTSTITGGGDTLTVQDCDFAGITSISTGAAPLRVMRCSGITGQYASSTSGASGTQQTVNGCRVDASSINFVGTSKGRSVSACTVTNNSAISVTESVSSVAGDNAVLNVTVDNQGTLQVGAQGTYEVGRVSTGATVTTGNFDHRDVIIEGGFTVTLTANNTNTLKNAGFSNII